MRSRLLLPLTLSVAAFVASSTPLQAATVHNRITSAISGSKRAVLEHSVPLRAMRASDLGAAQTDHALTGLSVRFSMTDEQQAELTRLLAAQQDPASPEYHQWLTPEQFGARFGLSAADMAKVSAWLTGQGFKITGRARSSTFITFAGTVAQAEKAFGTSIHSLTYKGEPHISNMSNPTVPAALSGVVATVTGLNDFGPKARGTTRRVDLNPNYTDNSSIPANHYLAPGDFYKIYNLNPLLNGSPVINGTGVTIAVMGQTQLPLSQVTAFQQAAGLPQKAPTMQLAPGSSDPGVVKGDVDEASLDVEWAGAAAPGATILYYYASDIFNGSLTQAIDNNVAPIITNSYGLCETMINSNYNIFNFNQLLQQANAQGMTVISAAGDGGATDCDSAGLASEGLAVDFPASSPFVTAAGGTMFTGDLSNESAYWNSASSTGGSLQSTTSVKQYIPESAWNETGSSNGLDAGGSGGGGASAYFAKPAWQTGVGVPNDGSRDVPDFALNAGALHDGYIVCSTNDCTNGFTAKGQVDVFGGTSAAAPTFAGMLALVEQSQGGARLGNIGGKLYGLANVANVFHDITSGNNKVACIQGTPNCLTGAPIGFSTGAGYDQATGLGSVDATMMVNNWASAVATGTGGAITPQCTIGGKSVVCTSGVTLSATGPLCGITSGSLALTAAVTSTAGMPTGTVQFYVDGTPVGNPVQLSGEFANYTLNTAGLSSGQHNVTAIYSGDSKFAGSKGSLLTNSNNTGIVSPIDVVSTTSPDFSITPCTASTNVASGAAANAVVLTITPTAGFTGSVNLSANSDSGTLLGYAFSVKPVVISSSSAGTSSFVLTATVTANSGALKKPASPFGSGRTPWYATGSGTALACLIFFLVPRRRRLGALFAVLLSVAAVGASGCGNNTVTAPGGGGGGTTTTNAQPGTYNITVTATSGNLVHSVVLTYNVQ